MRRSSNILLVVVAVLAGLCLAVGPARAGGAVKVHLVVVSGTIEGRDVQAELMKLKNFFLEKGGGYTELGSTAGGEASGLSLSAAGDVVREGGAAHRANNYSFLLSADHDLSAEIKAYVLDRFRHEPFILVWDAVRE